MHDSHHTDEFEDYLRNQVSEHRMYPSDKVWKNIRQRVHRPKKWPALSVFTILIISALVIGTILNKPVPDSVTPNFVYSLQTQPAAPSAALNKEAKGNEQLVDKNYIINQITSNTITAAVEKIKVDKAVLQLYAFNVNQDVRSAGLQITTTPATDGNMQKIATKENNTIQAIPAYDIASASSPSFKNIDNYLFDVTSRLKSILNSEPVQEPRGGVAFFHGRNESYNDFAIRVLPNQKDNRPAFDKLGKSSSRFDFRLYVAPSVSYRRLKEKEQDKNVKNSGASLESDFRIDPSSAINHTPALGYETGVGLGYKLNKRFSLTGGFQFNISQYRINAFLYKDEPTAFTLNEGNYSSTVNTVSSLRSVSGTTPLTIKNRYYQISMPLGFEWKVLGNDKIMWGVGASVQPTYTFDKQPLIISSNYKNYADGSAYVRNWNINTSAETFLGYTKGSYRVQVGPQFRYQMLPSLADKYPNREYLFNYGLKVGLVKQLK